jgi:hypothetical protein
MVPASIDEKLAWRASSEVRAAMTAAEWPRQCGGSERESCLERSKLEAEAVLRSRRRARVARRDQPSQAWLRQRHGLHRRSSTGDLDGDRLDSHFENSHPEGSHLETTVSKTAAPRGNRSLART